MWPRCRVPGPAPLLHHHLLQGLHLLPRWSMDMVFLHHHLQEFHLHLVFHLPHLTVRIFYSDFMLAMNKRKCYAAILKYLKFIVGPVSLI
jgi:hypothetical protein